MINKKTGRMEDGASISKVLRQLADEYDAGNGFVISGDELIKEMEKTRPAGEYYKFVPGLVVSFIPESKNHNGKPMMWIGNHSDVSTTCLEISEEGLFAYYVDDGVS